MGISTNRKNLLRNNSVAPTGVAEAALVVANTKVTDLESDSSKTRAKSSPRTDQIAPSQPQKPRAQKPRAKARRVKSAALRNHSSDEFDEFDSEDDAGGASAGSTLHSFGASLANVNAVAKTGTKADTKANTKTETDASVSLSGRSGLIMGSTVLAGSKLDIHGAPRDNLERKADTSDTRNDRNTSAFSTPAGLLLGRPGAFARKGRGGGGRSHGRHKFEEPDSPTNFINSMRKSSSHYTHLRGKPARSDTARRQALRSQVAKLKEDREKERLDFQKQKDKLEDEINKEKKRRRNAKAHARSLETQLDGKKGVDGLSSFMKNDQGKFLSDLKARNLRLTRENKRFVTAMETKVQEHLRKTQAQLLKDCGTMRTEIGELKTHESTLTAEVTELRDENNKLMDKFLALYADKGEGALLDDQMRESIAKLKARLETQTELNKHSHQQRIAYQDALGDAQSSMQLKAEEQEEYLQRAKAANQTELAMAKNDIVARNAEIERLKVELSFLSNSKKLHEMYKEAKQQADRLTGELAESAQQLQDMAEADAKSSAAHTTAMEALEAEVASTGEHKTKLQTEVGTLRDNIQQRISENEVAHADIAKLRDRAGELEKQLEDMATDSKTAAKQAKADLASAKAKADGENKQLLEQMQANGEKATAEMAAAQQQWQSEHEVLAADRAKVESALEERAKVLQQLEAELQEQQAAAAVELETQTAAHSTALKAIEGERDKVLAEHAQTLQEQQELQQFKETATVAASLSAKELDRLQADLSSHQQQLKGANADLDSHRAKIEHGEATVAELQKAKAELQSNLEQMTQEANEYSATSTAHATKIKEYTQQVSDMGTNAQKLEAELQTAAALASALQTEKEALTASGASSAERVASLEATVQQQEAAQVTAAGSFEERHAAQVEQHEADLAATRQQHDSEVASLNAAAEERISGLQAEWSQKLTSATGDGASALASLQEHIQEQQQTHLKAIQSAEASHAEAVTALNQQVSELHAGVEQRDAEASKQTAKVTELNGLLQTNKTEWEEQKTQLNAEVQERSKELEAKTAALVGAQQELAEQRRQLEKRTAEVQAQKATMASGDAQTGELRVELQSAESALAEHKALLEKEKAAAAAESKKVEKLQAEVEAEIARASKLSAELSSATTEHADEVSKLHAILQTQIEEGKGTDAKAAADLEEAKAAHTEVLQALQEQLDSEKAEHSAEVDKMKSELRDMSSSHESVQIQLDMAKAQLQASGADAAHMSAQMANLKKGTARAERAGEQERDAAELQRKKLALTVESRQAQLDAARMSLLLIQAAGLFDKSTDNETNHFEVVEKCARSSQMVSVLLGVECEGSLKDWHRDEARNLDTFTNKILEDVKAKKEGLEAANTMVTNRAEELTKMSESLSQATHALVEAYAEQSRIQESLHKAEMAEDKSADVLRTQYGAHVIKVLPLEEKQAEVLDVLVSASNIDKVHAIVARRDFTGQEWTDQIKLSVEASNEGLKRTVAALAESKKLVSAAGKASTEAERKKAAMQMKRMMAKQKKLMEQDAQRASDLREAETNKLMQQLEDAEKQKQEQAEKVKNMSADQKVAAEEAARRQAAQTEELRKALEARQAAAAAELAAKEAELKKEMEAKAKQLAIELAAKNDAEAKKRLDAELRRKEAAELAAKRAKDAEELAKRLEDKEAILNSINLLAVGDVQDEGKAQVIQQMREARRQMAIQKSAAAAAAGQKKTTADMTSLTSELSQLKASVEAQVRAAGEAQSAEKEEMSEELRAKLGNSVMLVEAAEDGDWQEVSKLLDEGVKPNGYDDMGYTPLIMGCHAGMETAVEILLERGARINFPAVDKSTPCHVAVQAGHMNVLDLLIEKKPNVNNKLKNGATALFIAAQEGYLWAVNMLLEAGANVDIALNAGATPLFMATQEGHYEIVQVLLQAGADVNLGTLNGATPLFISAQNGRHGILELLLECDAEIEAGPRQSKPAAATADEGDGEKAPEYEYITPLFVASNAGHHEVAKSLLKAKANPSASFAGFVPLLLSGFRGDTHTIRDLIDAGADSGAKTHGGWSIAEIMQEVHGISYQEVLEGKNLSRGGDDRDDDVDSEGTYHSSDDEEDGEDTDDSDDFQINAED